MRCFERVFGPLGELTKWYKEVRFLHTSLCELPFSLTTLNFSVGQNRSAYFYPPNVTMCSSRNRDSFRNRGGRNTIFSLEQGSHLETEEDKCSTPKTSNHNQSDALCSSSALRTVGQSLPVDDSSSIPNISSTLKIVQQDLNWLFSAFVTISFIPLQTIQFLCAVQ